MPTPLWSTERLIDLARAPHADVRAFALRTLAAQAPHAGREALAALSEQAGPEELAAARELAVRLAPHEDVTLPPALARDETGATVGLRASLGAFRRLRAAGAEAWLLLRPEPGESPFEAGDAFALLARQSPGPFLDRLRGLVADGQAARIPVDAVAAIAGLARPEDMAVLVRWAAEAKVAHEDAPWRPWDALGQALEAAGETPDGVALEVDTPADVLALLARAAPGTEAARRFDRAVLLPFWDLDGDRPALRAGFAATLESLALPADGPLAVPAQAGLALARALGAARSAEVAVDDLLLSTLVALARIQRADRLLRDGTTLSELASAAVELSGPVAQAVTAAARARWPHAGPEEREAFVARLFETVHGGREEALAAVRLAARFEGVPLEPFLFAGTGGAAFEVFADLLGSRPLLDASALAPAAVPGIVAALAFAGSRQAAANLETHWDTLLALAEAPPLYDAAERLGATALLGKLLDDWRPGEGALARQIRLLARLDGSDASLPAALISDADRAGPPEGELVLQLVCRECRRAYWYDVREVWRGSEARGEPAFVFGRILACRRCGAPDELVPTSAGRRELVRASRRRDEARVHDGLPKLADGTPIRRPSEAVRLLRARAEAEGTAPAWTRAAVLALMFDAGAAAAEALVRAMALDTANPVLPALLASTRAKEGDPVAALSAATLAALRYPGRRPTLQPGERAFVAEGLVAGLAAAASANLPAALRLEWREGGVPRIGAFVPRALPAELLEGLRRLLESDALTALAVVEGASDDEAAALAARLRAREGARALKAAPGRNAPCPCGSGDKYKRCCGG